MFNNLSPEYLFSLIPPTVNTLSQYNLRNAQPIQTVLLTLPSSIWEWNNLPLDVRNSDYVIIFKRKLNSDIKAVPRHFYAGNRRARVLHTRLQTRQVLITHSCAAFTVTKKSYNTVLNFPSRAS